MSEKRTVVDVVMVHLHCDKCNQRMEMKIKNFDDKTIGLPIHIYKCPNCGYESTSTKSYPYTEYQNK